MTRAHPESSKISCLACVYYRTGTSKVRDKSPCEPKQSQTIQYWVGLNDTNGIPEPLHQEVRSEVNDGAVNHVDLAALSEVHKSAPRWNEHVRDPVLCYVLVCCAYLGFLGRYPPHYL